MSQNKAHMITKAGSPMCGLPGAKEVCVFLGTDRPDLVTCARCKKKLQSAMRKRQRVDVTKLAATRR